MNEKQINIIKHTLGYRKDRVRGRIHRNYTPYRNYYQISNKSEGINELLKLVDKGLMIKRLDQFNENSTIFHVTEEGRKRLGNILDVTIHEESN